MWSEQLEWGRGGFGVQWVFLLLRLLYKQRLRLALALTCLAMSFFKGVVPRLLAPMAGQQLLLYGWFTQMLFERQRVMRRLMHPGILILGTCLFDFFFLRPLLS
jgi:hypothetical protein